MPDVWSTNIRLSGLVAVATAVLQSLLADIERETLPFQERDRLNYQ